MLTSLIQLYARENIINFHAQYRIFRNLHDNKMVAGRVLVYSRNLLVFVVVQFLFSQLKPHSNNYVNHVGGGYDIKPIHSRNISQRRSSDSEVNKTPGSYKAMKLLRLTESSLVVVTFILMDGEINPQPGPAGREVPTLSFKARGLPLGVYLGNWMSYGCV